MSCCFQNKSFCQLKSFSPCTKLRDVFCYILQHKHFKNFLYLHLKVTNTYRKKSKANSLIFTCLYPSVKTVTFISLLKCNEYSCGRYHNVLYHKKFFILLWHQAFLIRLIYKKLIKSVITRTYLILMRSFIKTLIISWYYING